jgi:hypothetical protein
MSPALLPAFLGLAASALMLTIYFPIDKPYGSVASLLFVDWTTALIAPAYWLLRRFNWYSSWRKYVLATVALAALALAIPLCFISLLSIPVCPIGARCVI